MSTRNKPLIKLGNFTYCFAGESHNKKWWRCSSFVKNCKARIHTMGDVIIYANSEHNHLPRYQQYENIYDEINIHPIWTIFIYIFFNLNKHLCLDIVSFFCRIFTAKSKILIAYSLLQYISLHRGQEVDYWCVTVIRFVNITKWKESKGGNVRQAVIMAAKPEFIQRMILSSTCLMFIIILKLEKSLKN